MSDLYATETWPQVLFITAILGGGAAWMTGRAIANTWRPYWQVVIYTLLLAAAVRFVHFALFGAKLISPASYAADLVFLLALSSAAWRMTLAARMVRQYAWIYERDGLFKWRERPGTAGKNG
jgi:hypothetical protein